MPKTTLTKRPAVASIKHPDAGTLFYSDPNVPGIRLAVGKTKKSWVMSKRINGKPRSVTLGQFPVIPTALHARDEMKEPANAITAHRDAASTGIHTLRDAMTMHISERMAEGRLAAPTVETYWTQVNTHFADIFDMPVERVTFDLLKARVTQLRDIGKGATADHCVTLAKMAFKRACLSRDVVNVAAGLTKAKKQHKADADKLLFDARETWPALGLIEAKRKRSLLIGTAWTVMLFTGFRSINVRSLTWDQVDFERAEIHFDKLKNGLSRTFPIADNVMHALSELPQHDGFVFFSNSRDGHIGNPDELRVSGKPLLRPHDCRRLFTTACRRERLPEYLIAQMRGDSTRTIADIYDVGSMSHDDANRVAQRIESECGK